MPSKSAGASHSPFLHEVARKGTRNYVPGAASTLPDTPDTETETPDPEAEAKAFADCVAIWDKGTHITKSKWRDICKRQLKERTELSAH